VRDAGMKVVLTGEGSDELLGGYAPFRLDLLRHNTEGQDPAALAQMHAAIEANNQAARGLLVRDGALGAGVDVWSRRLGWLPAAIENFSAISAKLYPLMTAGHLEAGLRADPYAELLDSLDVRRTLHGRDPVNQAMSIWTRTMLPNYLLTFLGDRMEMAHSVEGRVPFLDHQVAEYAAQLPVHYKIRGMTEKYILREAVRDVVMPEVYAREKHAFMSPPAKHDDDAMTVFCRDVLASSAVDDQPFFEPKQVRSLMDRVADMPPADRAAFEGVVLRVVSVCVLQERFRLTA
jgi:asparagine synthase (glutamine-hydrolysing)